LVTYAISGGASALAGVVLSGYVGSTYLDIGGPYLFTSIAAVIVGGASILGGSGTYWGTVAGALTLTVLSAMLPLFHLSDAGLKIVYGIVILAGVWLSTSGGAALAALRARRPVVPSSPQEVPTHAH
jgi:ribose transport system permease protein